MEVCWWPSGPNLNEALTTDIIFDDVRSDWYAANTLLPRLVVRSVLCGQSIRLIGFPTVWIPVCVHYAIDFDEPRPPRAHVPIFSDMSAAEIAKIAIEAKNMRRRIIDLELPAYCAQWRLAVARGADSAATRRDYGWRIAAQSGAMENRLSVIQRFERECT